MYAPGVMTQGSFVVCGIVRSRVAAGTRLESRSVGFALGVFHVPA